MAIVSCKAGSAVSNPEGPEDKGRWSSKRQGPILNSGCVSSFPFTTPMAGQIMLQSQNVFYILQNVKCIPVSVNFFQRIFKKNLRPGACRTIAAGETDPGMATRPPAWDLSGRREGTGKRSSARLVQFVGLHCGCSGQNRLLSDISPAFFPKYVGPNIRYKGGKACGRPH